jgi:hypothetical protein
MQYKTIILELIRSRPELHRRLKASKKLLPTVERHATLLKASHEAWIKALRGTRPEPESVLIPSEALEIAVKVFEETLLDGSEANDVEALSLDDAMAFLLRKTPTA